MLSSPSSDDQKVHRFLLCCLNRFDKRLRSADSMKFSLSFLCSVCFSLALDLSFVVFLPWAPLVMSSAIAIRFLLTDIKFLLIVCIAQLLIFVLPGNLSLHSLYLYTEYSEHRNLLGISNRPLLGLIWLIKCFSRFLQVYRLWFLVLEM